MVDVVNEVETKTKIATPQMYKVVFHNDNTTPMDFVVQVLMEIFHHTPQNSIVLMMQVHLEGRGTAGVYTKEIAEQKKYETDVASTSYGFQLVVTVEPE